MSIGVNYTGNGVSRSFEIDGVPAEDSSAASILGAQQSSMHNLMAAMMGMTDPSSPNSITNITENKEDVKVDPSGSLEKGPQGLKLKMDELGNGGVRFYSSLYGSRGYYSLPQLDPPCGGKALVASGDTPSGETAEMSGKDGCIVNLGDRVSANVDITEKDMTVLTIKAFSRIASLSANGRCTNINAENEREVLRHILANGKWSVRAFLEKKKNSDDLEILWLAFGAEEDLYEVTNLGEVSKTTKPTFQANEDKQPGEEDPVKVVKSGSGGGGKYGVMPIWKQDDFLKGETPYMLGMAYGTEDDLDTWDGSRFACNYDEKTGELLEYPPVKIVYTATCGWNPAKG